MLLLSRAIAEGIVKRSGLTGYQLGHTKVFLRAGQMAVLDKQRTEKMHGAAVVIQRLARGYLARLESRRRRQAVLAMQVTCLALTINIHKQSRYMAAI